MTTPSWLSETAPEPSRVPRLIKAQLAIGIVTFVLCVVTATSLVPLFKEKAELQREVDDLRAQIRSGTEILRQSHPITAMDVKYAFAYPGRGDVLHEVRELKAAMSQTTQPVQWKLNGRSPQEGFDSPSFAAYVLEQRGLIPSGSTAHLGEGVEGEQRDLRHMLNPVTAPNVGDVVFYKTGYTMFYFHDMNGRPFVIGMTPLGIASLEVNFADPIGYGTPNYHF